MEVLPTGASTWKALPTDFLPPDLSSRGLAGVEVLNEYKLKKGGGPKTSKAAKAKKRKREGPEDDTPGEAKNKKNKKSKKNKNKKRKPQKKDGPQKSPLSPGTNHQQRQGEGAGDREDEEGEEGDVVLRALDAMGFARPTPIQQAVLPAAMKGRVDILGAAETGSGKTLAFGIPMLNGILEDIEREKDEPEENSSEAPELFDDDEFEDLSDQETETGLVKVVTDVKFDFDPEESDLVAPPLEVLEELEHMPKKKLRALVLTPTRELAIQVKDHLEAAAKFTGIKVAVVVGGMAPQKQRRLLSYGPEIVVATPGRLWDLIREGDGHLANVREVKYLAIDETDRMVEKGHFEELHQLLEMLNEDHVQRSRRQNFVFSATLSLVHEAPKRVKQNTKKGKKAMTPEEKLREVMGLVGVKPKHKVVDLTRKFGTAETLTESKIHCDLTEKDFYLYYFTQMHPGRTLVFCNSIDCVRRLVNLFGLLQTSPLGLHAQMHQKHRLKSLDRFSDNLNSLMIATDVAARGLDIKDVQHVVHYQVPRTSESYVHRSGRTARASKEGLSVMLIDPTENQLYRKMCRTLNREVDLPPFPIDRATFIAIKNRVEVARELDKLKLHSKKEDIDKSWWKKAAEEAEIELSDDEDDDDFPAKASRKLSVSKAAIAAKQAELIRVLGTPLVLTGFMGKYPTKSGQLELPTDLHGKTEPALKTLETDSVVKKKLLKSLSSKKQQPRKKFKRKSKQKK